MGAEYMMDRMLPHSAAKVALPQDRGPRLLAWAVENFGQSALSHPERGARVAEEAIEVAQGLGVDLETVIRIARRTYSRARTTDMGQELGQLQLTLELAATNYGADLEGEAQREWRRVQAVSPAEWKRRHDAKIADGTAS